MSDNHPDAVSSLALSALRTPDRVSGLNAARDLRRFRLADAEVDVRGWHVLAADGRTAGTVARLIVETRTRAIRYLGITLDETLERRTRHSRPGTVLIPVGRVRRIDDICTVELQGITTTQLMQAPRIPNRPITIADENATLTALGFPPLPDNATCPYDGPLFDERTLFAS